MIASSTMRRAASVPVPRTGSVGAVVNRSRASMQLDRQQVLEQAQRRVGLADAQRRGRVVVFDAEVQRRHVQGGRRG